MLLAELGRTTGQQVLPGNLRYSLTQAFGPDASLKAQAYLGVRAPPVTNTVWLHCCVGCSTMIELLRLLCVVLPSSLQCSMSRLTEVCGSIRTCSLSYLSYSEYTPTSHCGNVNGLWNQLYERDTLHKPAFPVLCDGLNAPTVLK